MYAILSCIMTKYHETSNQTVYTEVSFSLYKSRYVAILFKDRTCWRGKERKDRGDTRNTNRATPASFSLFFSRLLILERNKASKRSSYSLD